jgi:hypothetical protein
MPKSQRKKLQADIDNSLILLSLALLTSPLGARMDARFRGPNVKGNRKAKPMKKPSNKPKNSEESRRWGVTREASRY